MDNIVIIIFLVLFILLFGIVIIKAIVYAIRSSKFVLTKAKIIDKVQEYTEEWGKYFPETWAKASKFYDTKNKIDSITESISVNNYKKSKKYNPDNDREVSYVFICEYEHNGKKYYYGKTCQANESLKKNLNTKVIIKYNPNNPKYIVIPKNWWKTVLICLILQIILGLSIYLLIRK